MVTAITPPRVLTVEGYQRDWKPQGWRLIIIGPTSNWRQEWGEWEAIRDIVQNALDEAEAYQWGYDEQGLWIADRGQGVAVADFLLGPPKLKPDWARGRFGEGLKVASLALLRKGYRVRVETAGRELWLIFLEQKVDGKAETLAALWRPDGITAGTRFRIIGYQGDAFQDRFAVNLPRAAIIWEAPSNITMPHPRSNQLIDCAFTNGARLYARDIYLRDIDSYYSYNLWGFAMAPDRHAPQEESQLWIDLGRLWCCVAAVDPLTVFLQMVSDPPLITSEESFKVNLEEWAMGAEPASGKKYADFVKDNASVWQTAWCHNFGENAVIRTSDRWDGTVNHLGYTSVGIQWHVRDTLSRAITTDAELIRASQARLREVEIIPDERLSPRQLSHLKLARAIVDEVCYRKPPVHAALIPPASDRVRTAGMYSRTTEEIYLSADQLEQGRTTVDTIIHEIAHHTSGAEDAQEAHNAEMTRVAARVIEATAQGSFDALLKEVVW